MRTRIRTIVFCAIFSLLGLSCTQVESFVVSTNELGRITKIVGKWSQSLDFVRIDCSERDYRNVIPETCFSKGEPNRVPEYAIHAERTKDFDSVTVSLSFFSRQRPDSNQLLESLRLELVEAFGAPNVKRKR